MDARLHRADRIADADLRDLDWLADLAGVGRSLVTLAPEHLPDGFVRRLAATGIRISVGHSEATAETLMHAIDDGLTGVTHLFNAMPPFAGRAPGIVGAALADARLTAGIIVDGIHVDPIAVQAAFAAKTADAVALVTDAMPTIGGALDQFRLMGRTISLKEGRLSAEDGTLAGAHLDMASAVRNAVRLAKLPLEDALCSASLTPALPTDLGLRGLTPAFASNRGLPCDRQPALAFDRLLDQWPELTIPNANQCAFAALWIRSKGLAQGNVGVGESLPLIWKLPLGDTGTPAKEIGSSGWRTR
jgi:hypothetical protein